ncbi:MAG: TolC family protein [Planctomycetota bacterium]|nr:TolC family protein [Planctomycetota bacterium]
MQLRPAPKPSVPTWRVALAAFASLASLVAGCKAPQFASTSANPGNSYSVHRTMRPEVDDSALKGESFARLPALEYRGPSATPSGVQQVAYDEPNTLVPAQPGDSEPAPEELSAPLPTLAHDGLQGETYPLDLPTALGLAGANNLQIAFAAERVQQAVARLDQADVLWVPSINAGVIYNNHAGRIQATEGDVIEVSRNSLYVGAGAGFGNAPLNGGSSGPARLFVDLPLVDVLFEPLAARQVVRASEANQATTFNDTLLQVAAGYLELVRAHSQVSIAQEAVDNAEQLAKITADFAEAGEGLEADAERSRAELSNRQRELLRAKESIAVASTELVRLLRLDPAVILVPTDAQVTPIDVVEGDLPLRDLIGMAQAVRPEADRAEALADETWFRARQEKLRPWMPHLYAGFSGGGFGGAPGGSLSSFSDRTDFDVGAVWELQNFGLGNAARWREQQSVHLQAHLAADQTRDLIASEVSRAFHQVQLRREQIDRARSQVSSASRALQLNLDGIRGRALRPIEAQQAITALAAARGQYLDSVISFNRAQFELLRAIGQPVLEDSGQ